MTHVIESDKLWESDAKGVAEGSAGHDLFKQRAATLLAGMNYSIMFTSSRVGDDGKISSGTLDLKEDVDNFITVPNQEGEIIVNGDKIRNIYNPDGSINDVTLRLCFAKLEMTPIAILSNPDSQSLHERFKATTGRDRLLEFMATKTTEAHKPQYEKWTEQARASLRQMLGKEARQKRSAPKQVPNEAFDSASPA